MVAYTGKGMFEEAISQSGNFLLTDPTNQQFITGAGYALAKTRRRREADEMIKKLTEVGRTQYVRSYWIATIYVALGEKDKAFAELERAFAERDEFLLRLKIDSLMDSLRDDPRYGDLLRRMNLPE